MSSPSSEELLTEAEVERLLKASRTTVWRLRKGAGLPHLRVGGQYRYVKSEVLDWLRMNPASRRFLP